MDFTLGILTGISLSLTVHQLLYIRDLRRKRKEREEFFLGPTKSATLSFTPPKNPFHNIMDEMSKSLPIGSKIGIYLDDKLIAALNSTSFPTEVQDVVSLQSQLEDAIAREDFKEAARIRDIMKKQ